ncbi:unnamed protein product [Spirodela intermedia]|uniref:Uncharacterized protein n=1 Tax=Spirodela intermedia TaxID=51605 RepID=A0A7I8J0E0_SPIIN|nr:unnamed protein product [Spirodela intermedia]CAA6663676.1 unnamed protein product [Spirodela intermedia]
MCKPVYECLLLVNLDDTLYPLSLGINSACRENIEEYMLNHLNIDRELIPKLCLELYKEHGTTMAGLKALGYEFDNDEYHKLKPDPVLRNLLLSMPQRKYNADQNHAAIVLSKMGLEGCFEGVICFETLNPAAPLTDNKTLEISVEPPSGCGSLPPLPPKSKILCKPSVEAMEAACQIAGIDPKKTIFFDDSPRNITSGKSVGLHTVIIGSSAPVPGADLALESIHNIKEALPEIWEDVDQLELVVPPSAIETVVLA